MPDASDSAIELTIVVLAAGKGTRFDGHKMMHPIEGIPMAIKSALNALDAIKPNLDSVQLLMVVQPDDHTLKAEAQKANIPTLDNPDFEQGMSTSIVRAVSALPPSQHILVCLGDMPFIQASTYQALIHAFQTHQQRHPVRPRLLNTTDTVSMGHPVLLPNHLRTQLLTLTGDTGANPLLKAHPPILVDTEDKGVIQDVDVVPKELS